MIYLLIQIKKEKNLLLTHTYFYIQINPAVYISPITLQLGTVNPEKIVFESVAIYLGNPLTT